jgi:hypothetical protein
MGFFDGPSEIGSFGPSVCASRDDWQRAIVTSLRNSFLPPGELRVQYFQLSAIRISAIDDSGLAPFPAAPSPPIPSPPVGRQPHGAASMGCPSLEIDTVQRRFLALVRLLATPAPTATSIVPGSGAGALVLFRLVEKVNHDSPRLTAEEMQPLYCAGWND